MTVNYTNFIIIMFVIVHYNHSALLDCITVHYVYNDCMALPIVILIISWYTYMLLYTYIASLTTIATCIYYFVICLTFILGNI